MASISTGSKPPRNRCSSSDRWRPIISHPSAGTDAASRYRSSSSRTASQYSSKEKYLMGSVDLGSGLALTSVDFRVVDFLDISTLFNTHSSIQNATVFVEPFFPLPLWYRL